ncbi:MAG: ABC transporter permease [Lachnospiraceae bacterium]|nr:ABC transporter permease [Lachnospiraceae bacterium]
MDMKGKDLLKKGNTKNAELFVRLVPMFGLMFVVVLFAILSRGALFDPKNIRNIIDQAFLVMVMSMGAAFVVAHGGMDLSVGAVVTVDSILIGALLDRGVPMVPVILLALAVALAGALVVGSTHVFLGIPVFLTSLAVSYILRGLGENRMAAQTVIYTPVSFGAVFNQWWLKLVFLIVMFALSWYLFNRTVLGKYQKALGGNPTVAALSGVNVKKYIILSHVIAALCAGMASVFSVARVGMVQATAGTGLEMDVIVALVLGGMPLSGGEKSRITAAVIGAITVTVLKNGLTLVGANVSSVEGITGVLFIICVAASLKRRPGEVIK